MENSSSKNTKLCPTCGTRADQDASRCLVCGTQLNQTQKPSKEQSAEGRSRIPQITLSIPVILLLFIVFLAVGAGLVYTALSATVGIVEPTPVPTDTNTPTPSLTPTPVTPTATLTPIPSPTPLTYFVQGGDTCGGIAVAFDISIQTIIDENLLGANCPLFEGMELRIPHPTATPTPLATNTLTVEEATRASCEIQFITVQEDETLGLIALYSGVPIEAIMEWNGKSVDTAFVGETLAIPLCMRDFVPGVGTTTPTPAPPYPAPELLLPRNGQSFDAQAQNIQLQWSSVGELRENEFYQITIIDITGGQNQRLVVQIKDTSFTVPADFRPTENEPHAFEWFIVPVAQVGVLADGTPIFIPGGPASDRQIFIWFGGSNQPQSTPAP